MLEMMEEMRPMFEPKIIRSSKSKKGFKKSIGKYTFPEKVRIELFDFVIREIRKHSDCQVAICKDTEYVWKRVGLELSDFRCMCQFSGADLSK